MEQRTCGCGHAGIQGGSGPADGSAALTRRGVLAGSAVVVASMALAGCAGTEETATDATSTTATPGSATPDATPATSAEPGAAPTGQLLATTTEFPVGGGKVVATDSGAVVVTQPDDGTFLAFDARCPHQGCPVREVTENTILCICHGSTFDGSTGQRLEGPAPTGLAPVAITVEGDSIYLA